MSLEEMKSWLVFVVKLSIALVFALATFSACWWFAWGEALGVTVVGAAELSVVGVGLLLMRLSTSAEVTVGTKADEKVLASGGTIGMKGIGWGGCIVCFCGTGLVATGVGV